MVSVFFLPTHYIIQVSRIHTCFELCFQAKDIIITWYFIFRFNISVSVGQGPCAASQSIAPLLVLDTLTCVSRMRLACQRVELLTSAVLKLRSTYHMYRCVTFSTPQPCLQGETVPLQAAISRLGRLCMI